MLLCIPFVLAKCTKLGWGTWQDKYLPNFQKGQLRALTGTNRIDSMDCRIFTGNSLNWKISG